MTSTRGVALFVAGSIAIVLVWRILAMGVDTLRASGGVPRGFSIDSPLDSGDAAQTWRHSLARNPADYSALLTLALVQERAGDKPGAVNTAKQALALAPADPTILKQTAALLLRSGEEAPALTILQRLVELHPDQVGSVWPIFVQALDSGRHGAFFAQAATQNPSWWPGFFNEACAKGAVGGLQSIFMQRASAGTVTADERRCLIGRLQRDNKWVAAYQLWLNSLPEAQRKRVGLIFNGDFENPISNLGFDWQTFNQDGVTTSTETTEGSSGRRALHVEFIDRRFNAPPLIQYLLLAPGRYRFEGRGRAEGLNSWLGLQWGLYCHEASGDSRQLAQSDSFLGSSDWIDFQQNFSVTRECPVQVLKLELANPRHDAKVGGNVAIRLRGGVWFDDLKVKILD